MRYRVTPLLPMILTISLLGAAGCGRATANDISSDTGADTPSSTLLSTLPCPATDSIGSTLRVKPGDAKRTVNDTVIECHYQVNGNRMPVLVKFQLQTNAEKFAARKQEYAGHLPTVDIPGLLDEAYATSDTPVVEPIKINTVVARKGSTEILVTAPSSIVADKLFIERIAATLK